MPKQLRRVSPCQQDLTVAPSPAVAVCQDLLISFQTIICVQCYIDFENKHRPEAIPLMYVSNRLDSLTSTETYYGGVKDMVALQPCLDYPLRHPARVTSNRLALLELPMDVFETRQMFTRIFRDQISCICRRFATKAFSTTSMTSETLSGLLLGLWTQAELPLR